MIILDNVCSFWILLLFVGYYLQLVIFIIYLDILTNTVLLLVYIYQTLFKHLPHQRKLDQETKAKALELMSVNGEKKLIQQELSIKSGKVVTLKDLHNLNATQAVTRNSLAETVRILQEQYG